MISYLNIIYYFFTAGSILTVISSFIKFFFFQCKFLVGMNIETDTCSSLPQ